ncbi:substrate-binding periplasmic protein [Niveibacterium sp.]|uniref:substrate-binding periplasmic protein n=1 Tax=Niveibacterium sp. TaxID=2017444 RepID=UPI0035B3C720
MLKRAGHVMLRARIARRIVAWLGLIVAAGTPAAPLQDCTRPLSVAYYATPPFYYRSTDGATWQGIDRDVVDELAQRTGCRFEPRFESRVRIWQQLQAGALDVSMSGIQTAERERFARFIPYATERNLVAVRRAATGTITPSSVLTDDTLTVAITRSYRYGPPFDDWVARQANGRVFEAADEEAAFRLLVIGRADAAIVRDLAWPTLKRSYPAAVLQWLDVGAPAIEIGVVLSRAQIGDALYEKFRAAILAMKQDGSLQRIIQRHVPPDVPSSTRPDGAAH